MVARTRSLAALGCVTLVLLVSVPVSAQIGDAISAYTGANAEGYLEPLAQAIGANLNSALFHSAHVPEGGLHISIELGLMAVLFSEDDETFMATTEMGFSPETTVEASTVVGPIDAIIVPGDGGTTFAFPGGFDLASFALAAPQIRIGSFKGTEAVIRYLVYDTGDIEIGDVDVQGYGLRHSISQYIPGLPVDIAAGFMYQSFKLDEGLIDATSFSFGAQASMKLPLVFVAIEPYAGLSLDTFKMDANYDDDDGDPVSVKFDSRSTAHLTLGLHARVTVVSFYGEYNIAEQNGFAFGLSVGF
ncbi:autotransporter domain-containing protein [bacterium]|nr:autotransporter domain-containing protein [bacterium]